MISNTHYNFFLIIPPGLEELARKELIEKSSYLNDFEISQVNQEKGGIEIISSLKTGFYLNYYLKIPTRILLRISNFKCRDFPKLFKKISKIKWSEYLNSTDFDIQASSSKSRLINTKRIEKAVTDGVTSFFKAQTPSKKMLEKKLTNRPQVFIRVIDDEVTLSIDTTGDRLNIRSYKTLTSIAPIRENIASALAYALFTKEDSNLIDPMCGSGTLLLEAVSFYGLNSKRSFSFKSFNIYNNTLGDDLKTINIESPFLSYSGTDIDEKNIITSKENFKSLNVKQNVSFDVEDLFLKSDKRPKSNNFIILNPPYGKRIKIEGKLVDYFQNVLDSIETKYKPKKIGIIIPNDVNFKRLTLPNYKIEKIYKFKNGGIMVAYLIFTTK